MKKILILFILIAFGSILKAQDGSVFKKGILVGPTGRATEIDSIVVNSDGLLVFYTSAGDTTGIYTPVADKEEYDVMEWDSAMIEDYTTLSTGNIVAGTGITSALLSNVMYYNGGSAIDISSVPQIADGYDGQIIRIIGSSDTNTLTLDDTNGLQTAGGASFIIGLGDFIQLIYIQTLDLWIECFRSNN